MNTKFKHLVLIVCSLILCVSVFFGTQLVSAAPTTTEICQAAPSSHFLYLPWDSNTGGDWHNQMTSVFDHDSPNYVCSTSSCTRPMKINVWTGEEARPKVASGGDGYGYCFGVNKSYGKCQTPLGEKIQGINAIVGYVTVTDEYSQLFYDGHDGYDWALWGGESAKILAAASGRVVYAQKNPWLGWTIKIDHLNGYSTSYSHLKVDSLKVGPGSCVIPGQYIADQGDSTGISDSDPNMGVHLHFKTFFLGDVNNPNDRSVIDPMGWCTDCQNGPPDPLIQYNGLSSINLWEGGLPHSFGRAPTRNTLAISWDSLDTTYMGGEGTLVDFGAPPTPGPTPTPGGPTATPIPPSGGYWNVKVFSAVDECKDNPTACNPGSLFKTTTVSGTNINQSFPDGKAFGTNQTVWGSMFTQRINFAPGTYYFHVAHDDGVKVWLNGQNIVDLWGNNETLTTCPGKYLSGPVDVAVGWKNTGGSAHLNFYFDSDGSACQTQTSQWNVKWYSDPNICSTRDCNPSQVYCEQNIQGGWFHIFYPTDGRACNTGNDRWGSIWKGTFNFPDGYYVFHADHDDGIKIFVGDVNNGNAIMDVGVSEDNNRACPAIHLAGDVPVTVIHKNEGGQAHVNVWWDTNTTVCDPPPAGNVWVSKDANDLTHVILENGDANSANLYLARNGQPIEITKTLWFTTTVGIEAVIPSDVDAFLVDKGFVPTIGGVNADEWYNSNDDPHWVVKKKLSMWTDAEDRVHLTYFGDHTYPQIRYYVNGVSGEQYTTELWTELADGSGIEATIPETFEAMKVDRWIRPTVDTYTSTIWFENNYWLTKKTVTVSMLANDQTKVTYHWGSALPTSFGRYGQELESRDDLWQTEQVDGHLDYYMILPEDVIAFQIDGGPRPQVDESADWYWGNYLSGRWVSEKTVWLYKNANNDTQVFYANPNVEPEDVPITYYLYNNSTAYQTTNWWTKSGDGLTMIIPRDIDTFVITHGPVPLIVDQASSEWWSVSSDGRWINRKPIRIWLDAYGKTYVTYWHEQTARPKIHHVVNGVETISTDLWTTVGDGIQARIPDGTTHFLVEVNNQPYIEDSAAAIWKFTLLPDLWVELVNMPTPTATATATSTPTATATPRPTATPRFRPQGTTVWGGILPPATPTPIDQ